MHFSSAVIAAAATFLIPLVASTPMSPAANVELSKRYFRTEVHPAVGDEELSKRRYFHTEAKPAVGDEELSKRRYFHTATKPAVGDEEME